MPAPPSTSSDKSAILQRVVVLSALGYFVDILDLFLFSVTRSQSLRDLGVPGERLLSEGVSLLGYQLVGLLCGAVCFGLLGDKRGRLKALYGSILLYSLATLVNARVSSLTAYAACRFVSGFGLSGELGAAVTLVSETLDKERRGLGTTIVAGFGLCGGIAAALLAEYLPWRTCYLIGGSLGLLLLILRVKLVEPSLFVKQQAARRGDLRLLFSTSERRRRFLRLLLIGVPIWFVAGVVMVFSPEISASLGASGVTSARAVLISYVGVSIGDFASGWLSQGLRSRRRAIAASLLVIALAEMLLLSREAVSSRGFYAACFVLGLGTGYWAVLVTTAAEQFGTNLRATVATTVPNLIRASALPLTIAFERLTPVLGLREAAILLAMLTTVAATLALRGLSETFGRDLDFAETPRNDSTTGAPPRHPTRLPSR